MADLRERAITLEVCPTSNLLTKALPDEDAVRDTFRAFSEADVPFTIATDGPEMMGTHLRDEFELLLRIGALDERGARGRKQARPRRQLRPRRAVDQTAMSRCQTPDSAVEDMSQCLALGHVWRS